VRHDLNLSFYHVRDVLVLGLGFVQSTLALNRACLSVCVDFLTPLHYLAYFCSYTSRCESMNTMISFLWWVIGFYWIVSGGEVLELGAPRLYWYASILFTVLHYGITRYIYFSRFE
jgi:hypothetical protein